MADTNLHNTEDSPRQPPTIIVINDETIEQINQEIIMTEAVLKICL